MLDYKELLRDTVIEDSKTVLTKEQIMDQIDKKNEFSLSKFID